MQPETNTGLAIHKKTPPALVTVGIVAVVLIAALVFLILKQDEKKPNAGLNQTTQNENQTENITEEKNNGVFDPKSDFIETVDNLDQAKSAVVGTSLVTPDNKVVNDNGQVVQNNALPMTPEAPRLSAPLEQKDISASSIKITADAKGFVPNQFTVKANQPVTIALTSSGLGSRLVFNDPTLVALEIPVPADYTMAKTFNAPSTPGEYIFYQDMPGRTQQTGKMIVE